MANKGYLCSNIPYNLGDIELGTLVPDLRYPTQDTLAVRKAQLGADYAPRDATGFSGAHSATQSSSFAAQLTALLQLSRKKASEDDSNIEADKKVLYELKSPKEFFKLVCAEPKARKWLQDGLDNGEDKCYFVVGLITLTSANVGKAAHVERSTSLQTDVPVREVVKANTAIDPSDKADAKLQTDSHKTDDDKEGFVTKDERIYAWSYKRVKLSTRKSISDAKISSKIIWRLYSDQRHAGEQEEEFCEAEFDDTEVPGDEGLNLLGECIADPENSYHFYTLP